MQNAVIVGAARTAIGSFNGALSQIPAPRLGATAIKAALERAGIAPAAVDEVIMGCVLPAGLGQAPARQAAIYAGLPEATPAMTINKVCGSGLKAVMLAAQAIRAGDAQVVVAGGMENMSQAPYLLPDARDGMRLGHKTVVDSMIKDGLWDAYNDFHMGNAAEICARDCNIGREQQDAFARQSYEKAVAAQTRGAFAEEIAPVEVPQRKGPPTLIDRDEEPGRGRPDKFAELRPAFEKTGTITAANASSINDGAAAVVVTSEGYAREHGLPILARIVASTQHAQAPEWFTTAPAYAIQKVLAKLDLTPEDIDLYEINEAFAVVSLAVNEIAKVPADRVNVHGGAVALGHPIGASGCRVLVTLLHAMKQRDAKRGLASLCIGGGEAVALVVER
ncbi:MAG: acetyl-CoA C-acetyltransferase [Myxococcales bacterium]|nr:acetyl-CoA C-acetyltransferase [Myxococcales bacterium]MCB9543728.1 acetyl-CoA C-acetyltransferase [Myxococcales bacterium]MCB9552715.1 acetyl-CoA C-acetyltransferase [Myxococcales bacterium]